MSFGLGGDGGAAASCRFCYVVFGVIFMYHVMLLGWEELVGEGVMIDGQNDYER